MNSGGHPVLGAISGLFLGIFIALDLILLGSIRIDSIMIYAIPILGLLLGLGLGWWAPLKRRA